ncbi:MAG: patatin-like phospholipase family protein [Candidatus Eisenbacteria bacterium]|nr:patatin-like phospholipase family protein [Candidatus Eisenbacteria bacterium]
MRGDVHDSLKIGLALGGGGVRGLAHVLALETIDTLGIRPAAIAGTSMGAIIGALYASGRSGRQIRKGVEQHIVARGDSLGEIVRKSADLIKWLGAVRPAWKKSGLLSADRFLHYLLEEIAARTFEDLEIPLQVVAADFQSGEPVVFGRGELLPAIRASMSIPGIFVPVEHDGRILVDGGIVNNLPYELLLDTCDVVVAIDVTPERDVSADEPPNVIEAILRMFDILLERLTRAAMETRPPAIYIRPRLREIPLLDFEKIEEVWEQAQPAMEKLESQLHEALRAGEEAGGEA